MDAKALEHRRQSIRQLVLRLIAPYARQLQPVELIWAAHTSSHAQQLSLYVQSNSEPCLTIPFSQRQLDSAVRPHDVASYRCLEDYLRRHLQPLIG